MTLAPTFQSTPVVGERRWDDALVPRTGGGWNWICQFYNYPNPNPTEWVVMHLETGDYAVYVDSPYTPGDRGRYTSGQHYLIANQLRDPNGLVWFPAVSTWLWYYDPADEKIHDLGATTSAPYDDSLYNAAFNVDGSYLLIGTYNTPQTGNAFDNRPQFITVNTSTKAIRNYGRIGSNAHTHPAIGYYVHADGAASNYAYALVGEDSWDVVSINLSTGAVTTLISATSNAWAFFQEKPEGLTVQLYTDYRGPSQSLNQFWVVDGAMYPYTPGYNPASLPFTPRTVTTYSNPIVNPPQVDYTLLPAAVNWRPNGSNSAYTANPLELHFANPLILESLLAMPDGSLLCNAQQYQGFARFYPGTGYVNYFGAWASGISEGTARLLVGTKAYISGYPNGLLFEYDTTQPWTQTARFGSLNPKYCGAFSDGVTLSGIKRAEYLTYSSGVHKVFMVGLRDRSGSGMGVGSFDTVGRTFGGTYAGNELYTGDCGIAVLDNIDRVVVGGQISSGDAQLIVYDRNLTEITRLTPIGGMSSTGRLFTTGETGVVVGLSRSGVVYRYNVQTQTLLKSVSLAAFNPVAGKEPSNAYQRADGSILTGMGGVLYSIDPLTLTITALGSLPFDTNTALAETSDLTLYATIGTGVFALTPVVGGDPPNANAPVVARPTITQTNGFYPRASLDNPDTVEALVSNLNEHAAALDTIQTAVAVAGVVWSSYPGIPETNVVGSPGDMCTDTLNGELYIKHAGTGTNTGWKLITVAA